MSSLTRRDRASLCRFTFSDGRQCRSPLAGNSPNLCPYHFRRESQALAAEKLGKDLSYFLSGQYITACDLSISLGRLIPALVRGDIKPKTARAVAYLAQILFQTIQRAQHEYINAYDSDEWRCVIRNSVRQNADYRNPQPSPGPPVPQQAQPQPPLQSPRPTPQPQPAQPPASSGNTTVAHGRDPSASQTDAPAPKPPLPKPLASSPQAIGPSGAPSSHLSSRAPFNARFTSLLLKLSNQRASWRSCDNPFRINTYKFPPKC